jgi:hypothetical protein
MTLPATDINEKLCTLDSWLSKATLSVCGFTAVIMDFYVIILEFVVVLSYLRPEHLTF